ncbi:MAG: alanine--tRNA ligase, partial [Verrucomicrobia bacterium]|nr:alanine--tRNA ligase [Verrucomicrobiota bacterium]
FFGEKYGARVRVVDMSCSQELCGGTHTRNIGTIGFVKITKEGSIASGVRRIEAVTGEQAENIIYEQESLLDACCLQLKTNPSLLSEKLSNLIEENKKYTAEIKAFKRHSIKTLAKDLLTEATTIGKTLFLGKIVSLESSDLPLLAEDLSLNKGPSLFILALQKSDSCHLFIKVSKELQEKGILAGSLIKEFAPYIEGSGGGKNDTAQAGGKNGARLLEVFTLAKEKLESLC